MDEKKVREAIKALKITIDIGKQKIEYNKTFEPKNDNEPIEKSIEHAKTAIEALEKQLPKKPIEINDAYTPKIGEFRVAKCPNCGKEVSDRFDVCFECRQSLDWNEVEE